MIFGFFSIMYVRVLMVVTRIFSFYCFLNFNKSETKSQMIKFDVNSDNSKICSYLNFVKTRAMKIKQSSYYENKQKKTNKE